MSSLIYNGISIDIVKTREVAFAPVFDVDGSYLYTKVSIAISGLINPKVTSYVGQSGGAISFPDSSPTASVQAIRHALLQPRCALIYDAGDSPASPLIVSPPAGSPCDAHNGPAPGPLTITRVDGISTFHVNYSIDTWIVECHAGGLQPTALLSNRYAQTHSVDSLHYTTITTVGQALFRTDLLERAGETADRYRPFLLPPVPRGFQRKGITIAITPARNALTYQVVDVERSFDLANASGVVDCKASYEVSSTGTKDGGVVSMMTLHRVQVQAFGNKNSSNWNMTQFCFRLAQSRLPIGQQDKGFVRQVAVTQSLTDRSVGLVVVMMLAPKKGGQLGAIDADGLRMDQVFPDQQGANPNMPNRKGSAGTYANELLVAAWKSACQAPEYTNEGEYKPGSPEPYTSPGSPEVRVYPTDDLPSYSTGYSSATCIRPYTDYAVTIEHETITSTMQVPLAGPAGYGGYVSGGEEQPRCAFLTLASPMHRRIVQWSAERVGEVPDVPSPNSSDPNLVLIDVGQVRTEAPSLLPDGETMCYRVSGKYVFGLKKPPSAGQGLPMGSMPWIAPQSATINVLPNRSFVSGIIDAISVFDPSYPVGPDN